MKTPPLLNCHACGHQVSAQAESCPKCAQPFRVGNKTSVARGVFWGLFSFFILLPLGIAAAIFITSAVMLGVSQSNKARTEARAAEESNDVRLALAAYDATNGLAEANAERAGKEYQAELSRQMAEATAKRQQEIALAQLQEQADRTAEILKAKHEREQKLITYQMDRASNGLPSFQLIIGQRYLRGDGVETNLALARHWLQSAATNGEPIATNLLSQLQ
jgi:TPR repeat protein